MSHSTFLARVRAWTAHCKVAHDAHAYVPNKYDLEIESKRRSYSVASSVCVQVQEKI